MHTKEPWPVFTDVAVMMTPDPEGTPAALLSWDDYIRAKACVDACAGMPADDLELCPAGGLFHLSAHADQLLKQRDELLAALVAVCDHPGFAEIFAARQLIASVKKE